jgi:hypothetical protein
VIIRAIRDSGNKMTCDTVDISEDLTKEAMDNLGERFDSLPELCFHTSSSVLFMDSMIKQQKRYGFVFVDAGHGYDNTYETSIRLKQLMCAGGYVLFHDYVKFQNFDSNSYYGVFQGVNDAVIADSSFAFCLICGGSALFRYVG